MVNRIRKVLRFEAEAPELHVRGVIVSHNCPIQANGIVKLHARFSRQHFQDTPTLWFVGASRESQFLSGAVQNKIVIVPARTAPRFIQLPNARAHRCGLREVNRGPLDRRQFARGD